MSGIDAEKSIRIIPFSGKDEDWRMWSRKFLARAHLRKYKGVLLGTTTVPIDSDVIDETTASGKVMAEARIANEKAYNDLLLSCEEEISFGAVDEAITNELANGDAKMAWDNLMAKFKRYSFIPTIDVPG